MLTMLKLKIQPYIDDLTNRLITNREVATALNVTESHLSRTLKDLGVKKVPAENTRLNQKTLNKTRKEHRQRLADTMAPERAAQLANCTVRTIYRYKKNGTSKL